MALTPDTQLGFQGQLRQRIQDQFGRVGLPAWGTVMGLDDVRLPISRNFNEAFASRTNFEDFLEAGITHRVNDAWTLKSQFRATYFYYSQGRISPSLQANHRTLKRSVFFIDVHEQDYRLNNMAIGRFDTLGIKHRVLLGVELSRHHIAYDDTTADLAPIDIVAPVYGASPTNYQLRNRQLSDYDTVGAYAQDVVTLLPQLEIVAGMRYDYSARGVLDHVMAGVDQSAYNGRVSPRAGVVYRPVTWAAWYASWSTSFVPVNDVTSLRTKGILFAPERGQQYETGVKFDIAPQLTSTLAIYQIKRKDVLTTNPVDPTEQIAVGEQRSRGVEWDVTWRGGCGRAGTCWPTMRSRTPRSRVTMRLRSATMLPTCRCRARDCGRAMKSSPGRRMACWWVLVSTTPAVAMATRLTALSCPATRPLMPASAIRGSAIASA
ncbi:MAG: TonB-dependent receptor [Nevskiaceae bacterium]|nr:MAG: TonB-dependent receptor [Nevskiaceae bacterium]TBR72251.1 MAG: TonB-dependent receptor [Nevskiaceae bacterium]